MNELKIKKVWKEFKAGKLKTSYGKKVVSKKQAMAIALSEANKKNQLKIKNNFILQTRLV